MTISFNTNLVLYPTNISFQDPKKESEAKLYKPDLAQLGYLMRALEKKQMVVVISNSRPDNALYLAETLITKLFMNKPFYGEVKRAYLSGDYSTARRIILENLNNKEETKAEVMSYFLGETMYDIGPTVKIKDAYRYFSINVHLIKCMNKYYPFMNDDAFNLIPDLEEALYNADKMIMRIKIPEIYNKLIKIIFNE